MSLDKVLKLGEEPVPAPSAADSVRAAMESLERLALLLAKQAEDDDSDDDEDDDEDDSKSKGDDEDNDFWAKKKAAKGKKKAAKDDKVKACSLVQDTIATLSNLSGAELIGPVTVSPEATVMALARGQQEVAMEHAPMSGEHEHPHRVFNVHSHKHTHNGDSRHACGDSGYGASAY